MTWWMVISGALTLLLFLMALGMPLFAAFLVMNVTGIFDPVRARRLSACLRTASIRPRRRASLRRFRCSSRWARSCSSPARWRCCSTRSIGSLAGFADASTWSAFFSRLSSAPFRARRWRWRACWGDRFFRPCGRADTIPSSQPAPCSQARASIPIIPPSVLAILVATIADVSTGKMLIAGIIPGLVLTGMFLVYVVVRVYFQPEPRAGHRRR